MRRAEETDADEPASCSEGEREATKGLLHTSVEPRKAKQAESERLSEAFLRGLYIIECT